jgi:hypothetical protein
MAQPQDKGIIDRGANHWYDNLSYLGGTVMPTVKIAVTIGADLLARLDQLVKAKQFPSRSRAVQIAIQEQLERLEKSRLAR